VRETITCWFFEPKAKNTFPCFHLKQSLWSLPLMALCIIFAWYFQLSTFVLANNKWSWLSLHSLRNNIGAPFSPLLGDNTLALHSLRNDFEAFSPLLGDYILALHSVRNDFRAFSPLHGDDFLGLHSLQNEFGAFWPLLRWFQLTFMLETWKSYHSPLLTSCTQRCCFGVVTFSRECTFIDLRYILYKYYILGPWKKQVTPRRGVN
jgi:hypothetical protein